MESWEGRGVPRLLNSVHQLSQQLYSTLNNSILISMAHFNENTDSYNTTFPTGSCYQYPDLTLEELGDFQTFYPSETTTMLWFDVYPWPSDSVALVPSYPIPSNSYAPVQQLPGGQAQPQPADFSGWGDSFPAAALDECDYKLATESCKDMFSFAHLRN